MAQRKCPSHAEWPVDRSVDTSTPYSVAVADSATSYFHAKFVHNFKVKVASQLLVDMTTIMADACDCSVRPILNCLLLF